ncbi:MAG: glucosamine-6-phosphate deaminase [Clostridia bacterium]|nr:glucosamine-6-phosphate deaminase [Clostridia bacterium]MBR5367621.1 glucosamine-6-phosphate deaminase [Clostridia bacterium]
MKAFVKDRLTVRILKSREEMGKNAARDIAAEMRRLLAERDEINMIFAAAPSQNETLAALAIEEGIDWCRVNAFHMDEYVGLPGGAPQSFAAYLGEHLFDLVPLKSVHLIDPTEDADREAERYAALLEEYPVDITVLGIGENGHIAFNDPGVADFRDPLAVKKVPLDEVCRMQQVHDGCFPALADVPEYALTTTIPSLTRAGAMFCSVPASSKADAVFRTVTGPISEECPATILRTHPHAILYCDPDSGEKLL